MKKQRITSLLLSVIILISSLTSCSSFFNSTVETPFDAAVQRSEDIYIKGYGITSDGKLKVVAAVKEPSKVEKLALAITPEVYLSQEKVTYTLIQPTDQTFSDGEDVYNFIYSDFSKDRKGYTEKLVVSPYAIVNGESFFGTLDETSVYKTALSGEFTDKADAAVSNEILSISEKSNVNVNGSYDSISVSGFDSVTYNSNSELYNFSSDIALTTVTDNEAFNYYTISYTSDQPVKGRILYTKPDGTEYRETFFLNKSTSGTFSSYTDFAHDPSVITSGGSLLTFENLGEGSCSININYISFTEKSYPSSEILRAESDEYKIGVDLSTGALTELSSFSQTKYSNYITDPVGAEYFGSENYKIIQTKDKGKLIDYAQAGNRITVVTRPYSNGAYADAYITTAVTAYNTCVSYSSSLADFYELGHEESKMQFAPILNVNSNFSKLSYYSGSTPWASGSLSQASGLGAFGESEQLVHDYTSANSERWCAVTDANNIGIGIFNNDADRLSAGIGLNGISVSLSHDEFIPTYADLSHTSILAIGTLSDIRASFEKQKNYGESGKITDTTSGDSYVDHGTYIVTNAGETVNAVNNYLSGPTVAIDDLNRELPLSNDTKLIREDRNVGLFYFLWLGEHDDKGVFDNTKITTQNSNANRTESVWGPTGQMHFFSEPLYGYYKSSDEWVMRKHVEELTNAGVDFLYLDVTNGYSYINNARKLMTILHEFNEQGWDAPKVVFYTHTSSSTVVDQIYNNFYKSNFCPDTWLMIDGKPVVVAYSSQLSSAMNSFFEVREPQWPNEGSKKKNAWPWISFFNWSEVYTNSEGQREAISVSVAQHCGSVQFSRAALYKDVFGETYDRGRSYHNGNYSYTSDSYKYGYNFQERWDEAIKEDVPYVLVTSWNEWVAQRQPSNETWGNGYPVINFVDTFNIEYSRDVEMTKGYYFDNYYMQLISNIRKYKGTAPTLHQMKRPDSFMTGIDDWYRVQVTYKDFKGDTADRNGNCFGNSKYTDTSGRNDIVASKVCFDSENIYFYVECASMISAYSANTTWMQLFINSDNSNTTGWYGFDYIINYSVNEDGTTNIAKFNGSSKTDYSFAVCGTAEYTTEGEKMMITIPASELGINTSNVEFSFKWADSDTKITTMEQFYTDGDSAPHGRLNFLFTD